VPLSGSTPTPYVPVFATLTLYGPTFNFIGEAATSSDNNRSQPALRVQLPQDGQYTIAVRGRGRARFGDFQLTVIGIPPDATPTPAPSNFLPFEEAQKARLDSGGSGSVTWRFAPRGGSALFVMRPDPDSTLRAALDIYTAEGFLEATATAVKPGDELRIPLAKLSSDQEYHVIVRALDGTSGAYTLYASGSLYGLVVFNATRVAAYVRNGPSARATYFTRLFGLNFEAFARTADRQWLRVRDIDTKRFGWVSLDEISVTYGDVGKLPVENP
jgi:hypothetical protein